MVLTDEKELIKLTKKQLVEKVKQAELSREEWHTRLTNQVAENFVLKAEIISLKSKLGAT